jgi:CRP-like cAMP-binding protein
METSDMSQQGTTIKLNPGQSIFNKGDPGGDLYFIKSGTVEVFTISDNQEVHLATLTSGEVLGVLTCLSQEKRMASARANDEVVAVKVSQKNFATLMEKLPKWMNIVLKEFTLRLNQMDDLYAEQVTENKSLSGQSISILFIASQLADTIGVLSDFISQEYKGNKVVYVDRLIEMASNMLGFSPTQLEKILTTYKDCGLIVSRMNGEKKKEYFECSQAAKLPWFANFVRSSKHGDNKKLVDTNISYKCREMLYGLFELTQKRDLDPNVSVTLSIPELSEVLLNVTGKSLDLESIPLIVKLGYVRQETKDGVANLIFKPSSLIRTLTSVLVIRSLLDLPEPKELNAA